jgi:drug/metabolite transporter (DMT)-like permease
MNRNLTLFLLLGAVGTGWGSTQVLGKWATSTGYQPFGLIFWQFVIATLVLGGIAVARGRSFQITKPAIRFAVVIAIIGTIIPNFTFYWAITRLPAGIMSIIIAAVPMMAFPIALLLGMDRFSYARLAGLCAGLLGVALIALPEASLPTAAMALALPVALLGPLFYAFESNFVAWHGTAGLGAIQAMALSSAFGVVLTLPLTLGMGQWINPFVTFGLGEWSLVATATIHALAYATYVWIAGVAGAVFAAQTAYIVTGSGILWAMVLLGERYSGWVWAALGAMMVGVLLVHPRNADGVEAATDAGETPHQ